MHVMTCDTFLKFVFVEVMMLKVPMPMVFTESKKVLTLYVRPLFSRNSTKRVLPMPSLR